MNKLSLFGIYMVFSITVSAQTAEVKNQDESVAGENVHGYGAQLEGNKEDIKNAWIKFLKTIGRVRQNDHITILDPTFNGTQFPKKIVHALDLDKGDKSIVWIGIKKSEWDSANVKQINKELEKIVHQFGVQYYHDKIQRQVDEAQQASDAVEKQKQRLLNQSTYLASSLVDNEKQKITLEKSLENNKLENAALLLKIKENKKAQDSLVQAGLQIQKIKLSHQERQKKVQ